MDLKNFNKPGKASVVIGGQFGSEGKGLFSGHIAEISPPNIAITNCGPNAGHTYVRADGSKIVTRHLPIAGVVADRSLIYFSAGSVIDPELLWQEVEQLGVNPARVNIHPHAAVISKADKEMEANMGSGAAKIASTQKGVGSALARRINRTADVARDHPLLASYTHVPDLVAELARGQSAMIEVPQGVSLSLTGYFYPHCTSRNISTAQAIADVDLPLAMLGEVLTVFRTFPIRVGHIVQDGVQIGHSGPVFNDQRELSFEDLGQTPEKTTVTGRIRRIFTFSQEQYKRGLRATSPTVVAMNFCNYYKGMQEFYDEIGKALATTDRVFRDLGPSPFFLYGFGPQSKDIVPGRPYEISREALASKLP